MFGPDVSASVTTTELHQIVEGIHYIEKMKKHKIDKNQAALEMETLRSVFTKSFVTKIDLPKGTKLRKEHLTLKKPGTGIQPKEIEKILGKIVNRNIKANELIKWTDLEN
jgi:sialic acid synthase SpsE